MAAPSYEALGILNLLFLLIGVLILLAVNTYVVWQWRHPEDRNEWFSAKLIVVLSMLASELVIIGLPLDVTNNQGSRDCSWEGGDYLFGSNAFNALRFDGKASYAFLASDPEEVANKYAMRLSAWAKPTDMMGVSDDALLAKWDYKNNFSTGWQVHDVDGSGAR